MSQLHKSLVTTKLLCCRRTGKLVTSTMKILIMKVFKPPAQTNIARKAQFIVGELCAFVRTEEHSSTINLT